MFQACVVTAGRVAVAAGPAQGQDDAEKAKEKKAELGAKTILQPIEAYYLTRISTTFTRISWTIW
ncbi:MAG TPA: hypothetical protein VH092_31850 [Urbifossiella sp.]|jgi:hypothetical protein|nr:hypothetical protein [Urbifossiella sp.]